MPQAIWNRTYNLWVLAMISHQNLQPEELVLCHTKCLNTWTDLSVSSSIHARLYRNEGSALLCFDIKFIRIGVASSTFTSSTNLQCTTCGIRSDGMVTTIIAILILTVCCIHQRLQHRILWSGEKVRGSWTMIRSCKQVNQHDPQCWYYQLEPLQ